MNTQNRGTTKQPSLNILSPRLTKHSNCGILEVEQYTTLEEKISSLVEHKMRTEGTYARFILQFQRNSRQN